VVESPVVATASQCERDSESGLEVEKAVQRLPSQKQVAVPATAGVEAAHFGRVPARADRAEALEGGPS
jgi:hypothetical protein